MPRSAGTGSSAASSICWHRCAAPPRRSGSPPGTWHGRRVLPPAATTHRMQRLEERGLVVRRPDPADGRYGVVELTEAGRDLVDSAVTDHVATLDRLLGELPAARRREFTATLAAVERNAAGLPPAE